MLAARERIRQVIFFFWPCTFHCLFVVFYFVEWQLYPFIFVWIQVTLMFLLVTLALRLQMQHCMLASLCILVVRKFFTCPFLFPPFCLLFCYPSLLKIFCWSTYTWMCTWIRFLVSWHLWYIDYRDAKVMWDQKTGRSRGFGFVSFRNQQAWDLQLNLFHLFSCLTFLLGFFVCLPC